MRINKVNWQTVRAACLLHERFYKLFCIKTPIALDLRVEATFKWSTLGLKLAESCYHKIKCPLN